MMNVLIIGSGGREHALALKIVESSKLKKLFAVPGNPGIAELGECHELNFNDFDTIIQFAKDKEIDMVVVGPEDPLANGLVDALEEHNIRTFGPNKNAAQFEASKGFARRFMKKYDLPSVAFEEFNDLEKAKDYIFEQSTPIVVKADGLAAGKGVLVAEDHDSAIQFAKDCLEQNKFGEASSRIIVEECLFGEEASYLVFMDSNTFQPMVISQDHKQIFEGDKGPNTGGMGTYSLATVLEGIEKEVEENILNKFLKGIQKEGIEYKGVLYVGLMKTKNGPKILEFNCRFGDPETQVILPRMKTDILDVFTAVVDQKLNELNIEWKDDHCTCVVLASEGYPGHYEKGKEITGLNTVNDVQIIHAGTKSSSEKILTNGGRVLNVVALGKDLKEATQKVYAELKKVSFEGAYYRNDIGKKELDRRSE